MDEELRHLLGGRHVPLHVWPLHGCHYLTGTKSKGIPKVTKSVIGHRSGTLPGESMSGKLQPL